MAAGNSAAVERWALKATVSETACFIRFAGAKQANDPRNRYCELSQKFTNRGISPLDHSPLQMLEQITGLILSVFGHWISARSNGFFAAATFAVAAFRSWDSPSERLVLSRDLANVI